MTCATYKVPLDMHTDITEGTSNKYTHSHCLTCTMWV